MKIPVAYFLEGNFVDLAKNLVKVIIPLFSGRINWSPPQSEQSRTRIDKCVEFGYVPGKQAFLGFYEGAVYWRQFYEMFGFSSYDK